MFRYVIAFGSNVGNLKENCQKGLDKLLDDSITLMRQSKSLITSPLRSDRFNTEDHSDYLNFLIEISSSLDGIALYERIFHIENQVGHSRIRRWAPRALDMDILFGAYHQDDLPFYLCKPYILKTGAIHIPHTEIQKREFLKPLMEDLGLSIDKLFLTHQ